MNIERWENIKIWEEEILNDDSEIGCDLCAPVNREHDDDCECCCHLSPADIYALKCDEAYNRINNK